MGVQIKEGVANIKGTGQKNGPGFSEK